MDIQHITLTAGQDNRLPLFPDDAAYLEALHRLGAVCLGCVALFALVGEHLHLVVQASREKAGRLAQASIRTLTPIVATPFASSHIRPVKNRSHMRWLLRYLLEQAAKHGMPGHPALWVGSCLPDLVGARIIEGLTLCISMVLPDYNVARALRIVDVAASEVPPATQETSGAPERLASSWRRRRFSESTRRSAQTNLPLGWPAAPPRSSPPGWGSVPAR